MKTYYRACLLILIFIPIILLGVSLVRADQDSGYISNYQISSIEARLPWFKQYIVREVLPPLRVGSYVSLALGPYHDIPYISFYQETNGNLMLAYPVSTDTGNCGENNNWFCQSIDTSGDVGMYNSIDMWGDTEGKFTLGISYYDAINSALKAYFFSCDGIICDEDYVVISDSDYSNIGLFTSLKFNSIGVPGIAYHTTYDLVMGSLMYAHPVTSGGNCGEGEDVGLWQCDAVDWGQGYGQYPSLDIAWDDQIHIAYYDADEKNLRYAHYVESGGNCGDGNAWQCTVLDGFDADVGLYTSLKAPRQAGGPIRIAYYDRTHGQLKFYNSIGDTIMMVDDMGTGTSPKGISMDIDAEGLPIIAYQQVASDGSYRRLRIARPYLSYNDGIYGNCGDEYSGHQYWRCTTLDGGDDFKKEADFVSLAINSHGLGMIAYSENDVHFNTKNLKIVYQLNQIFLPMLTKP